MGRIIQFENLEKEIKSIKTLGEPIILAGGCFDIIHQGHLDFLKNAKALGGKLMVLLESDATVQHIKGKNRPVHTQSDRAQVLSFLTNIDYIVCIPQLKTDPEYLNLVKLLKPDIIAITREDPIVNKKADHAKAVNAQLIEVIGREAKYSTSKIVKNIL